MDRENDVTLQSKKNNDNNYAHFSCLLQRIAQPFHCSRNRQNHCPHGLNGKRYCCPRLTPRSGASHGTNPRNEVQSQRPCASTWRESGIFTDEQSSTPHAQRPHCRSAQLLYARLREQAKCSSLHSWHRCESQSTHSWFLCRWCAPL